MSRDNNAASLEDMREATDDFGSSTSLSARSLEAFENSPDQKWIKRVKRNDTLSQQQLKPMADHIAASRPLTQVTEEPSANPSTLDVNLQQLPDQSFASKIKAGDTFKAYPKRAPLPFGPDPGTESESSTKEDLFKVAEEEDEADDQAADEKGGNNEEAAGSRESLTDHGSRDVSYDPLRQHPAQPESSDEDGDTPQTNGRAINGDHAKGAVVGKQTTAAAAARSRASAERKEESDHESEQLDDYFQQQATASSSSSSSSAAAAASSPSRAAQAAAGQQQQQRSQQLSSTSLRALLTVLFRVIGQLSRTQRISPSQRGYLKDLAIAHDEQLLAVAQHYSGAELEEMLLEVLEEPTLNGLVVGDPDHDNIIFNTYMRRARKLYEGIRRLDDQQDGISVDLLREGMYFFPPAVSNAQVEQALSEFKGRKLQFPDFVKFIVDARCDITRAPSSFPIESAAGVGNRGSAQ